MGSRIARALATGTAAAVLAGGAAIAATGTAIAAPTTSTSAAATSQHATTAKNCHNVKGYYKTVHKNGKASKVWVKPHKVCTKK
ncbi:hypothetical protein ABZ934_24605 [Streptomyces sp. NPDC046557]|uniref:hypothetical protein n=1 Tax=Streptomyces sp. NPDC046557 TaxID=3155372 RepID=UPI0033FAE481